MFLKDTIKRCCQNSRKLLLFPLLLLGITGMLINSRISDLPATSYCQPKTSIAFLKTHKCAGSTIQNILLRFGEAHNLTFVLPREGNYLGHPRPFNRKFVGPPEMFAFNVLAHHTRLDYKEIRKVMPAETVFVTIVREPVGLFESSFHYYALDDMFHCDIHQLVRFLPKYQSKFQLMRYRDKFGANQMFFDLGGDPATLSNATLVGKHLGNIKTWFDFVMVAEKMEESLILLKELMCWDLDDVVAFKLNARSPNFKSNLSEYEKQKLRELNYADAMLYDLFLEEFEKRVDAFGRDRMAEETALLKERTRMWYDFCVEKEKPMSNTSKSVYYKNPTVILLETRNVWNNTCEKMTMEELVFTNEIRERQMRILPQSFAKVPIKKTKRSKYPLKRRIRLKKTVF